MVACFFEKALIVGRLDADSKDDRKWNISELLLLRAWYRLLGVQPTLYEETHLKKKKGKAAGVQKKDRLQAIHYAPIIFANWKCPHSVSSAPPFKYTQSCVYQRRGGSANKKVLLKIGENKIVQLGWNSAIKLPAGLRHIFVTEYKNCSNLIFNML